MNVKRILFLKTVLVLVLLLVVSGTLTRASAGSLRLILMVDKSKYQTVSDVVKNVRGNVNYAYKYSDALSVTIPAERLSALVARPEVQRIIKDEVVSLPQPRLRDVPGYAASLELNEATPEETKVLSVSELRGLVAASPNNYAPYENNLTHTSDFWTRTSHFGENVVVAIIDAGVSRDAVAVGSRIVGAENFTDDGIPADSRLNGAHGTWVACCVGANAIFGFRQTSTLLRAVKSYLPSAVIPDYFGAGIDGIPMVGQAPLASFYALKVFPAGANSTSRSIIAAALERAIELRESFMNGTGGVNIRVVNMSLGGGTLYAGNDPLYAPLVKRAQQAGMVLVVSAGNDGPAGLTVGTPGDSKNILTAGATNDAVHERIAFDLLYGSGLGGLLKPVDNHIMADFSSRGPTADGRMEPNIVAPGSWRYAQGANTSISLVSGTSFSAPTVAGAAALLLSAHPNASPGDIRGALLASANAKLLSGKPTAVDQGFGFLDVLAAEKKFGIFNPPDLGLGSPLVRLNILPYGILAVDAASYTGSTGWLQPGQRKEYFIQTTIQPLAGLSVTVTVTPENPPDQQNQIFGDDAEVTIASAKTSFGEYPVFDFVPGTRTYVLDEAQLDMGMTRIAISGDYTNAGRIKADVHIVKDTSPLGYLPLVVGQVAQGDAKSYAFTVPPGRAAVKFMLTWLNGWEAWPTNDLDILLTDPDGNSTLVDNDGDGELDGLSWDTPERVTLDNPAAGQWTMTVFGSTVWKGKAAFVVSSDLAAPQPLARRGDELGSPAAAVPDAFALRQNYPNPFNPTTTIAYQLPDPRHVTITVYDMLGREVAALVNEDKPAGFYAVPFDGSGLASGMYLYRIQAGTDVELKRLVLLK